MEGGSWPVTVSGMSLPVMMGFMIQFRLLIIIVLLAGALGWPADRPVEAATLPRFQAQPLRVVTKALEPMVIKQNGHWVGFSIELWEALAEELQLDYEWVEGATVAEQLEAVQKGQADVAIAGISMTPDRERSIDFSHPYLNAGLQILTSTEPTESVMGLINALISPTLFQILGIGLLSLLVIAHIIWLIERGGINSIPRSYLPGIWESLWWALRLIASQEYVDNEKPLGVWRRLAAMLWIAIGVILIAQFTASVTASLTVQQLTGNISGPSDLPGKRIATVSGSTAAQYLEDQQLDYRGVSHIEEAYTLLEQGRIQAVVYDAPVLLYYANNKGRGKVHVAGPIFKEETYGIALPSNSDLREPINETLLILKQDGTYDRIYAKWFGGGE
jgi:polar amino acid transport system substrate-binding protein